MDKRSVFLDDSDKKRFIKLLYLCNGNKSIVFRELKDLPLLSIEKGQSLVSIGAYCLMGNHFHLLVKEVGERGISNFMRKLLTAYSSYFNKKYSRSGALFESSFKSQHLDTDEYLKYIFSYIHLNPLKIIDKDWRTVPTDVKKAEDFLSNYPGSSFMDYRGIEREEACILNRLAFPEYFPIPEVFMKEIREWMSYSQFP